MHKYHKTCSKLIWPFYGLIQLYERKIVAKFISPRVVCTNIPNRVLSWFDFFTAYYNYLNKNIRKLIYLREFWALLSQIVFLADLNFFRLLLWFDQKCEKTHISTSSVHKYKKIVFLADLTVLRIISTVWEENFTKLISPLVLCTSLPNRVLNWFDRYTFQYNCMKENVTKLIYARVLCTSVTNRVHCWFDQFTA